MRIIASHNIIILPKNWCFCNSFTANQIFFKYNFLKITPAEISKNHAENVVGSHRQLRWRAEPLQTSFSNSVRASFRICSQEEFSDFSDRTRQQSPKARLAFLLVRRWFGVARQRTKTSFCIPIFPVSQATLSSQFLNPRFTLGA